MGDARHSCCICCAAVLGLLETARPVLVMIAMLDECGDGRCGYGRKQLFLYPHTE